MPWVVGIDEAGYGPNLGPLVQAAVALRLPDGDEAGWRTLRPVVRRCRDVADGRLLVDDSKSVYTRYGLAALERGVWGSLALSPNPFLALLHEIALPTDAVDLGCEAWFDGSELLPGESRDPTAPLTGVCTTNAVAHLVTPLSFNRVCDECGSKAVVLGRGLVELIPAALGGIAPGGEPVVFLCDKLGGRNFYAAMLQEAFPNGWIIPQRECAEESRYRVDLLDRPVTVIFRPRADGESVAVALSSMLCKYLREVCMSQFNRFWAAHVPGIRPTAGYPGDARRFFDEIRPAMSKLGLTDDWVWRKR
jgi:hypothetical protein